MERAEIVATPRYVQIIGTPYGSNARSWLTIVARSASACDTSMRSNGSVW